MKKIILFFGSLLIFAFAYPQFPAAFNYQAVVRNSSGDVVADENVSFRITILQDSETGTALYSETHTAVTDDFGLVSLAIGKGTVHSGIFSPGGWGFNKHYIK